MNLLFIHQNFPGQFRHLAPAMAREGKHRVLALHLNDTPSLPGVENVRYKINRGTTKGIHPWVAELETKVIRGEAAANAARALKQSGFTPDAIIAHPGWGESLFVKHVWPNAKLGVYAEFFYLTEGADVNFDPEFPSDGDDVASRLLIKNAFYSLQLPQADAGLAPTDWQRSTFPEPFRSKISVIHDGIDTNNVKPNPDVGLKLQIADGNYISLRRDDEVITFVNRNLEPYRGYHIFMRALKKILAARPNAHVLIVGGNEVSYGSKPTPSQAGNSDTKGWQEIFLKEVAGEIDMKRVHFLGLLPYAQYLGLLQISTVHVYLTYPFVLSWSLLEAMSVGCAIVASDTAPVREVIKDGKTGRMVNFFDVNALADNVIELCCKPSLRAKMGKAARASIIKQYDLKTICLPAQIKWVESLITS
ncbi:RfaG Glycosyltransferase [Methylophilaceae bacterium]|jgi:glycosyltransferase involved in cell wall biosynthesis